MTKEEILDAAISIGSFSDSYSLDWGMEKLLKLIKRSMDETAEALDMDFFPPEAVLPIAQCTKEATEYTGISSLSKALLRWCERHEDSDIRRYAEEAAAVAEGVPF